eukprot:1477597-Prymnesium_polylepis.2
MVRGRRGTSNCLHPWSSCLRSASRTSDMRPLHSSRIQGQQRSLSAALTRAGGAAPCELVSNEKGTEAKGTR